MTRTWLVIALLVLAAASGCKKDGATDECTPGDSGHACGAGEYCAVTANGNVCWRDTQAPVVSDVQVACSAGCLRDGTLTVTATATDDHGLSGVRVKLDLDSWREVQLEKSGATWTATLKLDEFVFPYFEHGVVATVTAADLAGNESAPKAADGVMVTRRLWTVAAEQVVTPLSPPAITHDGTILVGGSNAKLYFYDATGARRREPVLVGTDAISAAPSVGPDAIWVGSQDGKLYALNLDGSAASACATGATAVTSAAVQDSWVVAATTGGSIFVASRAGACSGTGASGSVIAGPALWRNGTIAVAAGTRLRAFTYDGAVLNPVWVDIPAPTVGTTQVPLALGTSDEVWSVASDGKVIRTTTDATTTPIATLPVGSGGAVILSDGTAVVAGADSTLHRLSIAAAPAWTQSAAFAGQPTVPAVMSSPPTFPLGDSLVVTTSAGNLYAVNTATGAILWSADLSDLDRALQPVNVAPRPGGRTSAAYAAGADGKLYAVIVDGSLDTSAPWPKAFHDPRNTSNAGVAP